MMNSKTMFQEIVSRITLDDSQDEVRAIGFLIMETLWGLSKTAVMAGKTIAQTAEDVEKLEELIQRVNRHEPVQYLLGEAYFFGRKFQVNPAVLIPRQETEELVRVVLDYRHGLSQDKAGPRILDIGTGTGCIPITLSLEIPDAQVFATDVSNAALAVATYNVENLHAKVGLIEHDILQHDIPVQKLDVMVSNPPYVTRKEMSEMRRNVVDHEPHLALFVPDVDPLLFYKAIAQQAVKFLNPQGLLAVEINEKFGMEVAQLFHDGGLKEVQIIKDINGKDRVVTGLKALPV